MSSALQTILTALSCYQPAYEPSRDIYAERCQFCQTVWEYYYNEESKQRLRITRNALPAYGHDSECPVVLARHLLDGDALA